MIAYKFDTKKEEFLISLIHIQPLTTNYLARRSSRSYVGHLRLHINLIVVSKTGFIKTTATTGHSNPLLACIVITWIASSSGR